MEKGSERLSSQRTKKSVVRLYLLETTHDTATTWLPKQDLDKDSTNRRGPFLTTEFCVSLLPLSRMMLLVYPTHELVFLIYFSPFLYFATYSNF